MKITTRHADADLVRAITAYPAMRGGAPVLLPAPAERTALTRADVKAPAPARRHRLLRFAHQAG